MAHSVFVAVHLAMPNNDPEAFVFMTRNGAENKIAKIQREIMEGTSFWDDFRRCVLAHDPYVTYKDGTTRRVTIDAALLDAADTEMLDFADIQVDSSLVNMHRFLALCVNFASLEKKGFDAQEMGMIYSVFRDNCPENAPHYLGIQVRLLHR